MGRSRIFIRGKRLAAGADIFISKLIPWNAELKQIGVHVTGAVVTSELLTVTKISVTGDAQFDIQIRAFDLIIGPTVDLICNEVVQLANGDTLEFSYPNTDGIIVAVEAVIKEAE